MRFDLTDLQLFLAIVEAGSITHGADRVHLSLPSASARLRGMEEAIGIALLVRGRRGVAPTPAGEAVVHHARAVLKQMEQMRGELGAFSKGLKAHVSLLANTAAMHAFLPQALAPFLRANAHIDIDLKERSSSDIVKAIRLGLADIGIASDASDTQGLQTLVFGTDQLVVLMHAARRDGRADTLSFADIVDDAFIGLAAGSALQDYLGEQAARLGKTLAFRIRLSGFSGMAEMVAQDVGIAIMPERAAQSITPHEMLRIVPLRDAWARRQLFLCVRQRDELSPQARILFDALAKSFP